MFAIFLFYLRIMASRRSLCIDEILDIIDADTSDFAASSGDDDDDDIAFVPARIPTDVSSDDDFSSSDDEPLSSFLLHQLAKEGLTKVSTAGARKHMMSQTHLF